MNRVEGAEQNYIRCANRRRGYYAICWDFSQNEESGNFSYMEHIFNHLPTIAEIKQTIIGWYNKQIDEKILSGFKWNGMSVWLSSENQFNYKAAYDLAVQSNGKTLPVTFKFGSDDEPLYHKFTNLEEFGDFYTKAMLYIQATLSDGWAKKDSVDWGKYEM